MADLEQQRKLNTHFKNEQIDCFDSCKNQLEEMKKLYEKDEEEFDFTTNVLNTMLKEMYNVFTLFKNNTSSLIQLLGKTIDINTDTHILQ